MSRFWPVAESAQADYEGLRAAVLATGALPAEMAAARFSRRGLAGLIAWPAAEPVFAAGLRGAARPAWSPYADPRLDALAAAYRLLLAPDADDPHALVRTAMEQSRA
jgi:hypothetical protein